MLPAALSLILSADKEAGSMYLFLGWYPILKPGFDRLRPRLLGWAAKAAVFALAFAAMYALLCLVFRVDQVLEDLRGVSLAVNLLFYLILLTVMLLFDFILSRMLPLYVYRLRPRLLRHRRN